MRSLEAGRFGLRLRWCALRSETPGARHSRARYHSNIVCRVCLCEEFQPNIRQSYRRRETSRPTLIFLRSLVG